MAGRLCLNELEVFTHTIKTEGNMARKLKITEHEKYTL